MRVVSPELLSTSPFNGNMEDVGGVEFGPGDNGVIAWSYNPVGPNLQAGTQLTTSIVYMIKVKCIATKTAANLQCMISTIGSGFTSSSMALYSNAGSKLGETASCNTAFAGTGVITVPLSVGTAVTAGLYYHIAIRATATTRPIFAAIVPTIADVANANLGAIDLRYAVVTGVNTTMPASITMSARTPVTNQYIYAAMK